MALTMEQFFRIIILDITEEEYKKRIARLRRLTNEKFDLIDGIEVLENNLETEEDIQRLDKKKKRLVKVETMINEIKI